MPNPRPASKTAEKKTVVAKTAEKKTVAKTADKKTAKSVSTKSGGKSASSIESRTFEIVSVLKDFASKQESDSLTSEPTKQSVFVQISFDQSVEKAALKPVVISLPNPLYTAEHECCVIVRNPQRLWKDKLEAEKGKLNIKVGRVVDFEHLRKKFSSAESKRQLLNDFDVFYADERLLHLIPGQMGNHFVQAKKLPVGLALKTTKTIGEVLNPALATTTMLLRPGNTTSIRIGHANDSAQTLAQNAVAVLKALKKHDFTDPKSDTKKNWTIVSAHLHLAGSISLPLFAPSA